MTFSATMYAIKHTPTGRYMPVAQPGSTRGASFVEPVDAETSDKAVRLFGSARSAKIALSAWCKGQYFVRNNPVSLYRDGYDEEQSIEVVHVEGRVKSEFSVVTITLSEGPSA